MNRICVKPSLLKWACERSNLSIETLEKKAGLHKLSSWLSGDLNPTLRQLEGFARSTYTPFGYFFLSEPPTEVVPISDLRTIGNKYIGQPSPSLLETIYICQQKQEWYRNFARTAGEEELSFVGSVNRNSDIIDAAKGIAQALNFDIEQRMTMPTWTEALRHFIGQAESIGILVMINGIVGNNTHRPLNPKEFRGFALSDSLAPLVFINGKDSKAAQMFTLAHELAHIWLGETALSDVGPRTEPNSEVENWCNQVAAELLVPLTTLKEKLISDEPLSDTLCRLAKYFKVSTLVILRRLFDAETLAKDAYWDYFDIELNKLTNIPKGSGGDFYRTAQVRTGKLFARALIISTLEGNTLYRDAFKMLGCSKMGTFNELGRYLGVA